MGDGISENPVQKLTRYRERINELESFARWALNVAGAPQPNPMIALSRIAEEARKALTK